MAAKLDYAEVAKHNTKEDAWVIVDNTVYDLTSFAPSHPGGAKYIHKYAGKVATEEFLAKYELTEPQLICAAFVQLSPRGIAACTLQLVYVCVWCVCVDTTPRILAP
jgi:predicted heme/steroid binding protein